MAGVYSVTQVNSYIKSMFTQDFLLRRLSVKGEVSNCKYHSSGHIYFTLKDSGGTLSAVMFARQRQGLKFRLEEGQQVVVKGTVDVYERDGKYQLYASEIELSGRGDLYLKFEKLLRELEEMGMFAAQYKRPIPRYAKTVGIVTAPTGAAIRDIMNISSRRNPYVQLVLYPALVQGTGAKESIVKGIRTLDAMGLDVLIVGRGGGSIEDLWAFNEEEVARAIFACRTPVISAVGHETDVTISDYVADLRAPTPSGAAELAVADIRTFFDTLGNYRQKMDRAMENRLLLLRQDLRNYQIRLRHGSPGYRIQEMRTHLMDCEGKLESSMKNQIYLARQRLNIYIERMKGLSPLDKLNQGFSYVEDGQGHGVTSISQAEIGDRLLIRVTDGTLETEVKSKKREERNTGNGPDRK